jgi:hypothetical protein
VLPVDKEAFQLIDNFDKLRLLMDPQSQYAGGRCRGLPRMGRPHHRRRFATATIGDGHRRRDSRRKHLLDTESWQIASTFGSAAASGLTVAKMIEAKRVMRKAQVPSTPNR